jgi:hypothetical protein
MGSFPVISLKIPPPCAHRENEFVLVPPKIGDLQLPSDPGKVQ